MERKDLLKLHTATNNDLKVVQTILYYVLLLNINRY